jgi:hypothetical protein
MHDIDFLPSRYHQRRVKKVNWRWRALVACAFVGLMAAGWWSQRARRHDLNLELEAARLNQETAEQQATLLAAAQQQLATRNDSARLLVHLRHPWPRTQLLAAVAQPAPEDVSLMEVLVSGVAEAALGGPERASASPALRAENSESQPTGPSGDLARLRDDPAVQTTRIHVHGTARTHMALQGYLAALGRSDLFQAVEVVSLDGQDAAQATYRFQLRLLVRPGYGQPGGPEAQQQSAAKIAAK